MNNDQIPEYITALVDEETSDLSEREVDYLKQMVSEQPEYYGEYQLNIATKLCLIKHAKSVQCPAATADSIKSYIYHIYKSNRSSL